jgi:hypothetical protein
MPGKDSTVKDTTPVTPDPGTPVTPKSEPVMTPMVEKNMSPEDFAALRAQSSQIGVQDNQLGKMLDSLILHIGHLFGLDPFHEDARLAAQKRVDLRTEEDARLKAEADDRVKARALEDAQPLLPAQSAALATVRAQQDKQLQDEADARAQKRREEDAAAKGVDNAS